jgi:hypothetical protein
MMRLPAVAVGVAGFMEVRVAAPFTLDVTTVLQGTP